MKAKIEGLALDKLNPRKFGGMCSRSALVVRAAEGAPAENGFETIATTDAPALVIDWERWEVVREILPMKYCELPNNNKTPICDSHNRDSVEDILGYATDWRTTEHELMCKLFISETCPDVMMKIKEGTIDSVSLGYQTDDEQTVEIPKGNVEVFIDGVAYKNDYEDDYPLLVRTWWKGKEVSPVAIGADDAAKIKRAMQNGIKADDPEFQKLLNAILTNQKSLIEKFNSKTQGGITMPEPIVNPTPAAEPKPLSHAEKAEKDKAAIIEFGEKKFGGKFKALAETAVRAGMTAEQFNIQIMDALEAERGGSFETPGSKLGLNGNEIKRYSISRAVISKLNNEKCEELDMSDTIAKNVSRSASEKGFYMPFEITNFSLRNHPAMKNFFQRAHSAGTASEGGDFVATMLHDELLVEYLRNATVCGGLGATFLTGLRENFALPKVTNGLTVESNAENTAANVSYITAGLSTYSPKVIDGYTEYGKNLFYRSSVALDNLLFTDLNLAMDEKIDYLAINGAGTGNEPTGLMNVSGIPAADLSVLNWRKVCLFEKTLRTNKLLSTPAKFGMGNDVALELKTTPKVGAQAIYLMADDGSVAGYPGVPSNQFPAATLAYGIWSQLFLLFWGVREVTVDPYTKAAEWMVRIIMHDMMDVMVRRNNAFVISDNVVLQED